MRAAPVTPALARPTFLESRLGVALLYVGCITAMIFAASLLILTADASPADVGRAMLDGSFGSRDALANTLNSMAPLLVVAAGAAVASRAGLFNIGQEGQLSIGVGFAIWFAIDAPGPPWFRLAAALVGGVLGGALWAGIAAVMRYRFSVNEVIATLLLNFVAFQGLTYALDRTFLLKPDDLVGALPPQSANLPTEVRLPTLEAVFGVPAHLGIVLAVMIAISASVFINRTPAGRRLEFLGSNPLLARRIGVRASRTGSLALMAAGGGAGLAGALMLTGVVYRVDPGFSNNVGWNGLLVALVARDRPMAAIPVALLFGSIQSGGNLLASTGVPRFLVDVVQAAVVLGAILPPVILAALERRRERRSSPAADRAEP